MNTQNTTPAKKESTQPVMIEWGKKQIVERTIHSVNELRESKLIEKIAENFGYMNLVEKSYKKFEDTRFGNLKPQFEYNKFFVVTADPKLNYGLDFKLFYLYTVTNKEQYGMRFLREFKFSSSITSAPLVRVRLNAVEPDGFLDLFKMEIEDIKNLTEEQKISFKEKTELYSENVENNELESFEYSTNVAYKKDMKYRSELVELCNKYNFVFA